MLSQCCDQVGLEGLCRILSDSFSRQEIFQLVESFGLLDPSDESPESMILTLADAGMESPERDQGISDLLDRKNSNLIEAISQTDPSMVLENYIPQNPDCGATPGRILWALYRLANTPDLVNLLGIWNDFLKEAAFSSPSEEEEELHAMDESRIAQAERQAIESFKNQMGQSEPKAELEENDRNDQEIEEDFQPRKEVADQKGLNSDLLLARIEEIEAEQESIQASLTQLSQRLQKMERLFVSSMGGAYQSSLDEPHPAPPQAWEGKEPMVEEVPVAEPTQPTPPQAWEGKEPMVDEVPVAESPHPAPPQGWEGKEPVDESDAPFEEEPVVPEEMDHRSKDSGESFQDGPVLQQETIVLVGGVDHLTVEYEKLIKSLGGCLERYASIDEFSPHWLEGLVDRVHLVIVLSNAATRPGTFRLMEIAERLGKRLYVHHSTAPASLRRMLLKLVERDEI